MCFQDLHHAGAHEVYNRLRCIHDTVGIGQARRITLKELLVNGVQEVLFVAEIRKCARGVLDGDIKTVKALQVIGSAEALADERIDNLLYLIRNCVPLRELWIIEDRSEEALREQMLDEHLLHFLFGNFRVERTAAELEKGIEGRSEERGVGEE